MHPLIYELAGSVWAVLPEYLSNMVRLLSEAKDLHPTEPEARYYSADRGSRQFLNAGSVAVLPLHGLITHRDSLLSLLFGGTSITGFRSAFRSVLRDPSVSAIVIDVDSPGGEVSGVEELSAEVYAARGRKPMVAVANTQMASAAYWIASAADEIVVTPSGSVGSIGVLTAHEDLSKALEMSGIKTTIISAGKYKTEANPFEPLSADAKANMQAMVDSYGKLIFDRVAKNRDVNPYTVAHGFGQGCMVAANRSVPELMADRVATLDQTVRRLVNRSSVPKLSAMRKRELALYQ